MVSSAATTVAGYLAERRAVVAKVRAAIRKRLPRGFVEAMGYGMIGYEVPLARYPGTYNGKPLGLAGVATQKNDIPLEAVADLAVGISVDEFIALYEKSRPKKS